MRRKLIEADLIECVVGLGPNLFYNSPMEACVVVCRTQKPKARRGKIFFINAVNEVTRERAQSFLTDEHLQRVVRAYDAFIDEPGFTRVATLAEIRSKDGNLSIPLYVETETDAQRNKSIGAAATALPAALSGWIDSSHDFRSSLSALGDSAARRAITTPNGLTANPAWASLPVFDRVGWRRMAFGEFAESIGERAEPRDAQEEIYVGLEHLEPQCLHIRRWGKGSDVTGTKLRFRKGDIIFGRRRAYQRKLAVAEFGGICSAHAMVVRGRPDKVLPEFLPFLMMSDRFMNRAVEISVGSLSPTINWTTLKLETFDLPPLDQQRRIAELLWALDETSTQFELTLSSIKEATRAASDSIFESNERTRHAKAIDACDRITVGIVVKPASYYTDLPSGIPALRSLNVFPGRFDLSELVRLSPEGHKQNAKSELIAGDVVVVRTGRPGDSAVVSEAVSGMNLIDLILVRPKADLLPEYLVEFLNSEYGKRRVYRGSAGTAQQHLNVTEFERIDLPLPSLADQRHAIAKISALKSPLLDTQTHLRKLSELQMAILNVLTT